MATDSLIGQIFAQRYDVTGFLGEGGMGRIYLANDRTKGKQVALKVLHQHLGTEDEVVQRFCREMRAADVVDHSHSVAVYDYGQHDGRLYLSMEFVDGDALSEVLLDDAPLAPARAVHIARQIGLALGAAHSQGVVHRDLKPDNVMIGDPGGEDVVKVCDFGLARFVGGEEGGELSDFQTAVGVRVGTPHYMSPEYVSAFRCDNRSDLYAVGVLLFEMLAGAPPFDGRPYEILDAHVITPVPNLSERVPGVSPELAAIVTKLMAKKPGDRYQSAQELVEALDALEFDEDPLTDDAPTEEGARPVVPPVPVKPPTPGGAPTADGAPLRAKTSVAPVEAAPSGGRRVALGVVVAALVFGGLMLAIFAAGVAVWAAFS